MGFNSAFKGLTESYFNAVSPHKTRTAFLMTKLNTQTNLVAQVATRLVSSRLEPLTVRKIVSDAFDI